MYRFHSFGTGTPYYWFTHRWISTNNMQSSKTYWLKTFTNCSDKIWQRTTIFTYKMGLFVDLYNVGTRHENHKISITGRQGGRLDGQVDSVCAGRVGSISTMRGTGALWDRSTYKQIIRIFLLQESNKLYTWWCLMSKEFLVICNQVSEIPAFYIHAISLDDNI